MATEAVATQAGSWPVRPTLPAELAPRLADAAVVATTDLSVPCTVVIVGEQKWPSSSQGRSGMNVTQLDPKHRSQARDW